MKKLLVSPEGTQLVDLTAEEISAREAEEAAEAAKIQTKKDAAAAKETNKTSGKAKLKAGEALSDAEIKALFGD
jgi:lipoprotein NlpI